MTTVSDIVRECPGLAPLFEQLNIDCCCGGNRPLDEACTERGLDPATVAAMLNASLGQQTTGGNERVDTLSTQELVEHIVIGHHVYLRRELPRIVELTQKVASGHADDEPRLLEGATLARIRELTDDYTSPEWACNTTRAVYHSLGELERDVHQHVHKENNILSPRMSPALNG